MSSAGQGIGGIVGGAIGVAFGNPIIGAQIGIMIGGLLDPPKIYGPRLQDLTAQTSTYGAFIPRLKGTVATSGNVFWIQGDKLIERSVESGGKGGPVTVNFEYYASFAVGLCEGPIDGIRRIWIAGQLWYDAGSDDIATIIASNEVASRFTLYTGTDTQEADPLIQADRGAANVPAYRGLAYIVFEELPLKNYGNSLVQAQVKVEVVASGVAAPYATWEQTLPVSQFWQNLGASNEKIVALSEDRFYGGSMLGLGEGTWMERPTQAGIWLRVRYLNGLFVAVGAYPGTYQLMSSPDAETWTPHITSIDARYMWDIAYGDGGYVIVHKYESGALANPTSYVSIGSDLDSITLGTLPEVSKWIGVAHKDGRFLCVTINSNGAFSDDRGLSWTACTLPADTDRVAVHEHKGYFVVLGANYLSISADGVSWSTVAAPPHSSLDFACDDSRIWIIQSLGVAFSDDLGATWTSIALPVTLANICLMNGILYGTENGSRSTVYVVSPLVVSAGTVPLSTIVESECLQSDLLTAADLDVTELTDEVRGYRVSALAPLRGGIDPLRKAFPFDAIQHGYKIKFKKRGSASVATITEGELDAREAGASPGVRVSNVREMDTVLPRQLTVNYIDATREYDTNTAEESRE